MMWVGRAVLIERIMAEAESLIGDRLARMVARDLQPA